MERVKEILSLYLFPVVLLLIGGAMLIYGMNNEQTSYFNLGGGAVLFVGFLSLLYSLRILGRAVQLILLPCLILIALGMAYLNYDSVQSEIKERKKAKRIHNLTVQGLKDIRKVEIAYKERYGRYTGSFDTLVNFLKNDSIAFVKMAGNRPDTLTEKEALERGIIKRDTLYTPVQDSLFDEDQQQKVLKGDRAYPFEADSLPYKRGSGKKFILKAGKADQGGVSRAVFMAKDPAPYKEEGKTLKVGSMAEPKTSGNWGGY
ncbi:MAG: hypothetical protein ABEH38_03160 [Flavobacteriales bacterium]